MIAVTADSSQHVGDVRRIVAPDRAVRVDHDPDAEPVVAQQDLAPAPPASPR